MQSRPGSDFWRHTSYGFTRHSGHALLVDLLDGQAIEVGFQAQCEQQFDQAGVFVIADERHWAKAGLEFVDGVPQLGAVVTAPYSDWSVTPAPHWSGEVRVRASRQRDSITIRARHEGERWQLVRVFTLPAAEPLRAGPYLCSPEGPGLAVTFNAFESTPGDPSLHDS